MTVTPVANWESAWRKCAISNSGASAWEVEESITGLKALNRANYAENRPSMRRAVFFYVESAGLIHCLPSMIACSSSLSPPTSPPGSLFDLLAQYARSRQEAIACASRYRMASYRKIWSRIERATARLQGEWLVAPGDVVAYCGQGHPDALVLYLALVRCGARLWPLEHPDGRIALADHAAGLPLKMVLFDDDGPQPRGVSTALPLSTLIGSHCPHEARAVPFDPAVPSLLRIDAAGQSSQQSLLQLQAARPSGLHEVHASLFDQDVLGRVVLPTLAAGETLVFL
jgi:hypothetical protein